MRFLIVPVIVGVAILLPHASLSVSGQDPDVDPPNWELGLDEHDGNWLIDENGKSVVNYWVRNDYLVPLSIDFEYQIPYSGVSDGEESVEIPAGSNESFEMKIESIDPLDYLAGSTATFRIGATITSYGPIPSPTGERQEVEGDLEIPRIIDLKLSIEEPSGAANAGTQTTLSITVTNEGNSPDTVKDPEYSDNCPQLAQEGFANLNGVQLSSPLDSAPSSHTETLTFTIPLSHPTKKCHLTFTVRSFGDQEAGLTRTADETSVDLDIEAATNTDNDDGNGDNGGGDDGPDDPKEVISGNFLALPNLLAIPVLAFAAIFAGRRDW